MVSFFELGAEERLGKDNKLLKLDRLIDWKPIEAILKTVHKRDEQVVSHGGFGYDKLKMFKAVLLGQWHSLSDPALEEALRVRLDFMRFTGFSLGEEVADETTLCRFRNKLIARGLEKKLLIEINRQLEQLGLKVEKARAAVVDATIIESAARPRRVLEMTEDRKEEQTSSEVKQDQVELRESCDPDARWVKKGKKSHFGYKGFVATDEEGFITDCHTSSANKSEVRELEHLLPKLKGKRMLADKGYFSKENIEKTKQAGLKNGIMFKASRNHPLTKWQKVFNKLVSKSRYIVEQGFGTLKRKFKFARASYMGLEKVAAQLTFKSICSNLVKAINKVQLA